MNLKQYIQKKKERRRLRKLLAMPRMELTHIIEEAIEREDGCLDLKKPVVVFVNDDAAQMPVVVRRISCSQQERKKGDGFEIEGPFRDADIDKYDLARIAQQI